MVTRILIGSEWSDRMNKPTVINLLSCAVSIVILTIAGCTYSLGCFAPQKSQAPTLLPTLYIIGDSTVNNSTKDQMGWGTVIPDFFDTSKIRIENRARGGRSSRTYLTEGLWDQILAEIKPGDFVLMQFGHNDGGAV